MTHTHIVIGKLSETLSLVKDVETSQRGYVITGQESYLKPYQAAIPLLKQNLAELKAFTKDNQSQQQRLLPLTSAIESRLSIAENVIDARRTQGFPLAQRLVLKGDGKQQMDVIRSRIARMDEEERRLLKMRSSNAQVASRFAFIVGASGLFIVAVLIFLILNLVRLESARRMEVEAGLATANLKLQDSLRVMERLTQEMTLIASLAEMLQSCRTEDEAYNVIQRTLPQAFPDAAATLSVINASQNLVETVLQVPENPISPDASPGTLQGALFSPNDCWALRRGHIHLVQDAAGVLCPHLAHAENSCGAMLCLPLVAHSETLGVLTVLAKPKEMLSDADQRMAFAVAEHVSLALANLKLQQTLRTQSIRDPLSGLFNRRYLEVSFEREIARARRHQNSLSVLMIDIDFFKKFNDSFGHEAGDELLKGFGSFLQNQTRAEDIACRYGGEEFTVILPDASLEAALMRAEQLRLSASQLQVDYRRQRLPQITISTGVAAFPAHGEDGKYLMRAADAALYRAKREGRDRVLIAEPPAQIED